MNLSLKTKFLNSLRSIFLFPPLEKLLVKLNQGKSTDNIFAKFAPNYYQYKKGSVRKVQRNGINYQLDPSELFDWHIYYGFLDHTRPYLYNHISTGDTIIDVGANMGETSFSFAKKVGDSGQVVGFEPDQDNYRRLTLNYNLNDFKNLTILNKGLGNKPGTFVIKENETEPGNAGSKRIIGSFEASSPTEWKVEIVKLDDILEELTLENIHLIKMDIEGYELNALRGAEKTIQKYAPKLFLELHDIKLVEQGHSGKDLMELLHKWGYTVTNADTDIQITTSDIKENDHFDILCLPKS